MTNGGELKHFPLSMEKEFDRERSAHKKTLLEILWCDDMTRFPWKGYETVEHHDKPPRNESFTQTD